MSFRFKYLHSYLLFLALTLSLVSNAQLSDWETGNIQVQEQDTSFVNELLKKAQELRLTNSDSALIVAEKAFELSEYLDYADGAAEALKNLGVVQFDIGNYYLADQYFKRALEIYEQIGDLIGISNIQNNLGSVYQTLGDQSVAIEYFNKSIENGKNANDPMRVSIAVLNKAVAYSYDETKLDKAIEHFKESDEIFREIHYTYGSAVAEINLGEILLKYNKPNEAIPFLNDALLKFKEVGVDPATPFNMLGQAYFNLNEFSKAEDYYSQALHSSIEKRIKK